MQGSIASSKSAASQARIDSARHTKVAVLPAETHGNLKLPNKAIPVPATNEPLAGCNLSGAASGET